MSAPEEFDYAAFIAAREKTLQHKAGVFAASWSALWAEVVRAAEDFVREVEGVQRGREGSK